jgi:hypothetical protein
MQPYFDPTRKRPQKNVEDDLQKKKWKTTSTTNLKKRYPNFLFEKLE